MRVGTALSMLVLSFGLAACGPVERIDRAGEPGAAPENLAFDAAGLQSADLDRGEILSLACQACHPLMPGDKHNIGPNLYGVFGRSAASAEGFEYSQVLADSGLIWSAQLLDAWLADPAGFLPGNNMAFAGYRAIGDRSDLIAFLMVATGADPDAGQRE